MKLNVKMTADELMNVIDSAVNEAMDRGYDGLDVDELTEDMCHVVDAALSAMGIEIEEEVEPCGEVVECHRGKRPEPHKDNDPIEEIVYVLEGKRVVSKENALNILTIFYELVADDDRIPDESKSNVATAMFLGFCEDNGIWGVDNRE